MEAGSLIKRIRLEAGLSQAALAAAAGTSQSAIAAYESGAKSPAVRTLERILRTAGFRLVLNAEAAAPARGALLEIVRAHRSDIARAARLNNVTNVRIFGSAARGQDTGESDLDLLVDIDSRRYGLTPLIAFRRDVEALVGRTTEVSTQALLKPEVLASALTDAVPL